MGSPFGKKKMLRPLLILHKYVPLADQWSAVFDDYVDNIKQKKVLLDHAFVSARMYK